MAGALILCGACGGPSGQAAPPDAGAAEAAPTSPSVSAIVPPRVFLARTTEVTLSGYATHWSAATKVDFGPGITIEDLVVASPTALVARVTTTKSTPTGVRDVVVDDGSARERYAGVFEVQSPLSVSFQGAVAQGALAQMTLQVVDTSTPLDINLIRNLDGTVTYPDLALTLPTGVGNIGVSNASDFEVTFGLSVDVDATSAAGDIDLVSGPAGGTTDFPLPSGLKVAPRTASALAPGVAATGQIMSAFDSVLYQLTPPGMAILDFSVSSTDDALDPAVALLPSSGHFADLLGFGYQQTAVAPGGMPVYAVYWENTGGTGPYSVCATASEVQATAPATLVDQDWQGAVAVSGSKLPFVLTGGDLSLAPYGRDLLQLSVAGPITVRLQTTGDLATDTRITVYQSDHSTVVGYPIDTGFAADGTVALAAAGTYYVEFSQGMDYPLNATHTKYTGIVRNDTIVPCHS